MKRVQTAAYVIDPRLPGGTSSAVAEELRVMRRRFNLEIHGLRTQMFQGDIVAPQLDAVLRDFELPLHWDTPAIQADLVIFHNPSVLKFNNDMACRIITKQLVVVTHENFLRSGGHEGFDVAKCLDLIDRHALATQKVIAPISPLNRQTVLDWTSANAIAPNWKIAERDWFNICDFKLDDPVAAPLDRRGRLSRPGHEKFPPLEDMDLCFPDHAAANVILGANSFIDEKVDRPHWTLLPFRQLDVDQFMSMIDFMVYFTAPTWRESFGRVIAEAIAAGKLVITDAQTASNFGDGPVAASPEEVDAIIDGYLAEPESYRKQISLGQAALARFSPDAFLKMIDEMTCNPAGMAA